MPTPIESVFNGIRRVIGLQARAPISPAPGQDESPEIEALSTVSQDHDTGEIYRNEDALLEEWEAVQATLDQNWEDRFPPRLDASEKPFIVLIASENDIENCVDNASFEQLLAATTWQEYDNLPGPLRSMGKFYENVWDSESSGFKIAITSHSGDYTYVAKRYGHDDLPYTVRSTQGRGTINDNPDIVHGEFRTLGDAMQAAVLIHNNPKTPQVFVFDLADDAREEQTVAHNAIVNKLPKIENWRQPDPDPSP
ncbi:hypothetical protein ACYPKM_04645 [Pseudomonas aeruginosa]